MKTHEQYKKTFKISRGNLLALICFTYVNIILTILDIDLFFIFSAKIPLFLLYLGSEYSIGIILAFVLTSVYTVIWLYSKKYRAWIVAALVCFSIDSLFSVYLIISATESIEYFLVIQLVFIAWIMYNLVVGTIAWHKLESMLSNDESTQAEHILETDLENRAIPIAQMPLSTAIRPMIKKGRVLISKNYNNMEIVVKRTSGATELIVDGSVYAEKTGVIEGKAYILEVNVNNVIINVTTEIPSIITQLKGALPTVYLYVNGNLIGKKTRYY